MSNQLTRQAETSKNLKLDQTSKQKMNFTAICKELKGKYQLRKAQVEKYEAHVRSEMQERDQELVSMATTHRRLQDIDEELCTLQRKLILWREI